MPAIIGPVQIVNVTGGVVHFGDSLFLSPKSASKSSTGAGAVNTGIGFFTANGVSTNNVLDTNLLDQPVSGNN
ncbi:spore germination protein [Neobacillus sp. D3-1R]|uniref:spore germination protein n=1 Tax=Neobacillus sp. D3-1R TaxID=3445778 RepID=UPI003F9F6CCD